MSSCDWATRAEGRWEAQGEAGISQARGGAWDRFCATASTEPTCWHRDLRRWAPRTVGKGTSAVLGPPPVCGTLSWRPRKRIQHPRGWNRKVWTWIRLPGTCLSSSPWAWPPSPQRTCPQAPPPLTRLIQPERKRAEESEAPQTEGHGRDCELWSRLHISGTFSPKVPS